MVGRKHHGKQGGDQLEKKVVNESIRRGLWMCVRETETGGKGDDILIRNKRESGSVDESNEQKERKNCS